MNELDLTPFKVEFDREISHKDLQIGDYFVVEQYDSTDDCWNKWPLSMLILDPRTSPRPTESYDKYVIFWANTKIFPYVEFSKNFIKESCRILAIYRINKFKY